MDRNGHPLQTLEKLFYQKFQVLILDSFGFKFIGSAGFIDRSTCLFTNPQICRKKIYPGYCSFSQSNPLVVSCSPSLDHGTNHSEKYPWMDRAPSKVLSTLPKFLLLS